MHLLLVEDIDQEPRLYSIRRLTCVIKAAACLKPRHDAMRMQNTFRKPKFLSSPETLASFHEADRTDRQGAPIPSNASAGVISL